MRETSAVGERHVWDIEGVAETELVPGIEMEVDVVHN